VELALSAKGVSIIGNEIRIENIVNNLEVVDMQNIKSYSVEQMKRDPKRLDFEVPQYSGKLESLNVTYGIIGIFL
jgi:hypothetical protein